MFLFCVGVCVLFVLVVFVFCSSGLLGVLVLVGVCVLVFVCVGVLVFVFVFVGLF